ncbi:TOBE domain-containing protein [Anaerosinus massiliensis]|uniref:TOBE domain-containing protein n=1 Tax=Massilibacillus massiliensis TaxID=1806837 RepID=UPI000A69B98B|nr:TOBE domain-containing protein [Massilibacillus massiliensis]
MKISARNQLKGTVVSIQEGAVNAIVGIKIASGDVVTATVSMNAVKDLDLKVGKEAYAIIKATSVMIGIE